MDFVRTLSVAIAAAAADITFFNLRQAAWFCSAGVATNGRSNEHGSKIIPSGCVELGVSYAALQ
jgi:hypothetical protein